MTPSTSPSDQTRNIPWLTLVALLCTYLALSPLVPKVVTHLAALLALAGLIFGWAGLKRLSPNAWLLYGAFAAYVGSALLSLLNNEDWAFAGWRFERYHPFLFTILLLGLLARFNRPLMPVLVGCSLVSTIAMAGYAGYEFLWLGHQRAATSTGIAGIYGLRVNTFAHVAYLHTLALLAAALAGPGPRWQRALYLFGAALGFIAGLATVSRGATLGFIVALATMLALYFRIVPQGRGRKGPALFLVLAFVIGSLPFFASERWRGYTANAVTELAALANGNRTFTPTAGRVMMWQGGVQIWREHPWIGTGIGDGQNDLARLRKEGDLIIEGVPISGGHHFHNIYIEMLASTGLVGLVTMLLALFIVPARLFWQGLRTPTNKRNSWTRAASLAGLSMLVINAVYGLTNCWLCNRGLAYVLIFFLLLIAATGQLFRGNPEGDPTGMSEKS